MKSGRRIQAKATPGWMVTGEYKMEAMPGFLAVGIGHPILAVIGAIRIMIITRKAGDIMKVTGTTTTMAIIMTTTVEAG